ILCSLPDLLHITSICSFFFNHTPTTHIYTLSLHDALPISLRAKAYGMPGLTIDGNNILTVIDETNHAIKRARNKQGPTLIEAKTYRYSGHSKSDKQVYRTQQEVTTQKLSDPIKQLE